jgi:hypothetical protein
VSTRATVVAVGTAAAVGAVAAGATAGTTLGDPLPEDAVPPGEAVLTGES